MPPGCSPVLSVPSVSPVPSPAESEPSEDVVSSPGVLVSPEPSASSPAAGAVPVVVSSVGVVPVVSVDWVVPVPVAGSVSAKAAPAAISDSGAMAAVAAAVTRARRSFMKTSRSRAYRPPGGTNGGGLRVWGAGVALGSDGVTDRNRQWLSPSSRNSYVEWVTWSRVAGLGGFAQRWQGAREGPRGIRRCGGRDVPRGPSLRRHRWSGRHRCRGERRGGGERRRHVVVRRRSAPGVPGTGRLLGDRAAVPCRPVTSLGRGPTTYGVNPVRLIAPAEPRVVSSGPPLAGTDTSTNDELWRGSRTGGREVQTRPRHSSSRVMARVVPGLPRASL